MMKLNQRTKLVVLLILMVAVFAVIYVCGMLIAQESINGSFLEAKSLKERAEAIYRANQNA